MKRVLVFLVLLSLVLSFASAGGKGETQGSTTTAAATGKAKEAPMLAELVAAGKLPPVAERLPKEPLVLTTQRSAAPDGLLKELKVGKYGGTIRLIHAGQGFGPEMYFATIETLLTRPGWISMGHPLTGGILRSYEISADKTTFTLRMREGMKWSDGKPLTTEDVRFYHEDILLNKELTPNVGSSYRSELLATGDIYKLDILDAYTFRITFTKPTPGFLDEINKPWMDYTQYIQPKHYLQQFHAKYATKDELDKKIADAKLLANEWFRLFQLRMLSPWEAKTPEVMPCPTLHPWIVTAVSATTVTFERNPYYYKVDTAGNQLPYVDKIVSTKVESTESASLKIVAAEVDLADELARMQDYPLYKENEAKGGYKVIALGLPYVPAVHVFNFATSNQVWNQVVGQLKFRQALNYAVNRKEIIDAVYYGLAEQPTWNVAEYSPAKANQLLDEIGLNKKDSEGWRLGPDGKRFEINIEVAPHLPDAVPANELAVEHYKAVGLYTTLKSVDIGLLLERRLANTYQIDTVWNEATTMYAFGHAKWHLIDPIPNFQKWYNTGGKDGVEPPAWFKGLYDLGVKMGPGIPWDEKILTQFKQTFKDTVPQINLVENPKKGIIVNGKLQNVFTTGVTQWVIYAAEQLYYD